MDQTLGRFASYGSTDESPNSWGTALLSSSTIYAVVAIAAVIVGSAARNAVTEKPIDLTFTERIAKPEPPPPPPPIEVKAAPPPAAAPVVPKNMKVRQLDKPPPPKEMVAPKEMPKEAPREADPSQDKGIAVFGEPGDGDPAGLEGGTRGGVAGQVGAIALPEDAEPPLPLKTNTVPSYPQEAKATGKTGTVILKVIIQADGRVADVQVMRGDEPFVGAAISAVKSWRYEPARYKGQPITVYRIIQIPFKLNA